MVRTLALLLSLASWAAAQSVEDLLAGEYEQLLADARTAAAEGRSELADDYYRLAWAKALAIEGIAPDGRFAAREEASHVADEGLRAAREAGLLERSVRWAFELRPTEAEGRAVVETWIGEAEAAGDASGADAYRRLLERRAAPPVPPPDEFAGPRRGAIVAAIVLVAVGLLWALRGWGQSWRDRTTYEQYLRTLRVVERSGSDPVEWRTSNATIAFSLYPVLYLGLALTHAATALLLRLAWDATGAVAVVEIGGAGVTGALGCFLTRLVPLLTWVRRTVRLTRDGVVLRTGGGYLFPRWYEETLPFSTFEGDVVLGERIARWRHQAAEVVERLFHVVATAGGRAYVLASADVEGPVAEIARSVAARTGRPLLRRTEEVLPG